MPLKRGHCFKSKIMEEVFAEYLDQLFYKGYAEKFKDDNPDAYESQLTEFKNLYSIPKHETSLVYNGTNRNRNRSTSTKIRNGVRRANKM